MKTNLYLFYLLFILSSCSVSSLQKLMVKTPKLNFEQKENPTWNDYQKDAFYFSNLILQAYPLLYQKIDSISYIQASQQLIEDTATIDNDFDFQVRLQQFEALLKDGHSNVFVTYATKPQTYYSMLFMKEEGEYFLTHIDKSADSSLVSAKLLSINHHSMDSIENLVINYASAENEYYALQDLKHLQYVPAYWKALGLTQQLTDTLTLEVEMVDKTRTIQVPPKEKFDAHSFKRPKPIYPFTKKQNEGFSYKILPDKSVAYLQMNTSLDYVAIKSEISNYVSALLKPLALASLKKRHKNSLNFGKVLQELFTKIHQKDIKNLIIDLRYNTGGDERLGKQLIWYLTERKDIKGFRNYYQMSDYVQQQIKVDYKNFAKLYEEKYNKPMPNGLLSIEDKLYDNPYFHDITQETSPFLLDRTLPKFNGNVYILIGNYTFSAAQVLATTLKDNKLATLVGAPTGNQPTTQTGASTFKLPQTKTTASISYFYMERPDTSLNHEKALYPDIEISPTVEGYFRNVDEVFEGVLEGL